MSTFVPLAAVILVECLIFTSSPPSVFHVESGGWDLLLCQMYGDLVAVLPTDKQTENQTDNLGGFFVDYPKILVVRVFDIAVRGFGDNRLSTHAFGLNAAFDDRTGYAHRHGAVSGHRHGVPGNV